MAIKFFDLKRQYKNIDKRVLSAIKSTFSAGNFILGREERQFEKEFARYCGTKYAIGVASGTDALRIALMSLGIGKGDEVITVPNTAVATVCAIEMTGATPIFVDVGEDYLIDTKKIEKAITARTKAIIPVHLYGLVCDMDKINSIARTHGLYVIEDAAQAHGASFKNKRVGSLACMGCFSFYPTKNLGAYGDGGAITTNNFKVYKKALMLRNHGWGNSRDNSKIKGINSRLDEIQAAMLRIKLRYLDSWSNRRRLIASKYNALISKDHCKVPPSGGEKRNHCYHMYVIRTAKRNALRCFLSKKGIDTLIHYPVPIHLQTAYKNLGYKRRDLPRAEKFSGQILSLPIYPELKNKEVTYIAEAINGFFKN